MPFAVGDSIGEGADQRSVIGVMTAPQVARLSVKISGRPLMTVGVKTASRQAARRIGLPRFGYAAVAFSGPGCMRQITALDRSGVQVGEPLWGC